MLHLPDEKLQCFKQVLQDFLHLKRAAKCQLQVFAGRLSISGNRQLLQCSDAERNLSLKVAVPVILTRNLPDKLCNGTTGKVVSAEKDKPPVINFNGRIVTLDRICFEVYDPEQEKVLAVPCQYPIKLAFTLTVHWAHGQTKDKIEIDC